MASLSSTHICLSSVLHRPVIYTTLVRSPSLRLADLFVILVNAVVVPLPIASCRRRCSVFCSHFSQLSLSLTHIVGILLPVPAINKQPCRPLRAHTTTLTFSNTSSSVSSKLAASILSFFNWINFPFNYRWYGSRQILSAASVYRQKMLVTHALHLRDQSRSSTYLYIFFSRAVMADCPHT